MRQARWLLIAPLFLLTAASPSTRANWFLVAVEGGAVVGYVSQENVDGPDGLVETVFQSVTWQEPGQPVTHITRRVVTRLGNKREPREVFDRTDNGSEWREVRAEVTAAEAVITRSTRAGKQTVRLELPERLFAYDYVGPSRCPLAVLENFELNTAALAVERIAYRWPDAPPGRNDAIQQRYQGSALSSEIRLTYDGDCRRVSMTLPLFGKMVTMRRTDRETALASVAASR